MVTRMRSRWNNKNGGGRCSTRSSSSLLNELQRRLRPWYVGPICCLRDPDSIGHRLEKPSRLTFPFESCRLRVFPLELIFGYNPPLNVSSTLSTHLCHSQRNRDRILGTCSIYAQTIRSCLRIQRLYESATPYELDTECSTGRC